MAIHVEVLAQRSPRTAAKRWVDLNAHRHGVQVSVFGVICVGILLTGGLIIAFPGNFPPLTLTLWVVVGALFLPRRRLFGAYLLIAVTLALTLPRLPLSYPFAVFAIVTLALMMIMMYVVSESRARLGISGFTGENMLVDLRDRLAGAGHLPPLPPGWIADQAVLSANGDTFSGDFLVTAMSLDGRRLEVALVDVSGKGRQAGSRSLHLSGALSGLIGSVPPEDFLQAANSYLLRQRWDEGFASAVHLDVDLVSGTYSIGRAGHPAPGVFHSGRGAWTIERNAVGTVLGIMPSPTFVRAEGRLERGDALLLYSDGVIEAPGGDLYDGVDRMLGFASQALLGPEDRIAQSICGAAPAGTSDDRSVFVLRRD